MPHKISPKEYFNICSRHDWHWHYKDRDTRADMLRAAQIRAMADNDEELRRIYNAFIEWVNKGGPKPTWE